MNFGLLTWLIDHLIRRKVNVRVRVHRANLLGSSQPGATASSTTTTTSAGSGLQLEIARRLYERARDGTLEQGLDAYFINVWNASPVRSVGVTHVWIATAPETPVMTRQPPALLAPDAQWETWIEVDQLPEGANDVEYLARVKLTNGSVVESVPREDVPAAGYVPG